MTSVKDDTATAAMRAQVDQLRAAARERSREAFEEDRRAAQLAYEADLIDDAALALAELQGVKSVIPRLETAVRDAITAERAAEDRLRLDERHLARRRAEQQKAEDGYAPVEQQEQLADRVRTSERVVAAGRKVVGKAREDRQKAQAALAERESLVAELDCEHAEAARKAANPGAAPNLPGLVPGIARLGDMDEEARQLIGAVVLLAALESTGQPGGQGAKGGLGTTRGGLAQQDPGGFRFVRTGTGSVAIPPHWTGTR